MILFMPFLNITFSDVLDILDDLSYITQLLKEKKINPKEADLLELLSLFKQKGTEEIAEQLKMKCFQCFETKGKEAYEQLNRFIESQNKQVAWGLFARSFKMCNYNERDPLEEYIPKISEIITSHSKYKLIR